MQHPEQDQPPEGNVSYRDPAAIAQVRANAQRVAQGKVAVNPSTNRPYTEEDRALAGFVDRNLGAREERESSKGGIVRRAADAFALGRVNSDAYEETTEAGRRGDLASEADLARLGLRTRAGETLRTEPTFLESAREEMLPAAIGQLPYFALPLEGAAGLGARSIGEALEGGGTLFERSMLRARQGAIEGLATGAAVQAGTERQRGATGLEAAESAAIGTAIGAPFGAGVNVALGAVGDVAGAGIRAGREALLPRRVAGDLSDLEIPVNARRPSIGNAINEDLAPQQGPKLNPWKPIQESAPPVSELEIPLNQRLEDVVSPEDAPRLESLRAVSNAPNATFALKEMARDQIELMEERYQLRPAAGAADDANVVVQMDRERAAAEQQVQLDQQIAEHPAMRQEATAQASRGETEGPVALPEATRQAAEEAKAGDPDATAYQEAVNRVVDATVAARDAGDEPSGKVQLTLARAKQALNAAREKYGARLGASAILGLAANDDDLSDEEKKMVGLGGLAVLGTEVVRHIPRETLALAGHTIQQLARESPELRRTPEEWYIQLHQSVDRPDLADGGAGLISYAGGALADRFSRGGDEPITASELLERLNQTGTKGFVSRLRSTVADTQAFPKKWDELRPAADWIGKLKGSSGFKKDELAFIQRDLERAQAIGQKLSRSDILAMVDERLPEIERVTLAQQAPAKRVIEPDDATVDFDGFEGDHENIRDIDELIGDRAGVADTPLVGHDEIGQQVADRLSRIHGIEREIEDAVEDAERELSQADDVVGRRLRELRDTLGEFGQSDDAANAALDYINEHTFGDEWADVKEAMAKIADYLEDNRDPEDILKEEGYSIDEAMDDREFTATWTDDEGEHTETFTLDHTETEADALAYVRKQFMGENPHGLTIEQTGDGTEVYVVRDQSGKERYSGDDRDQVIQEAISEDSLSDDHRDEMYGRIEADLNDYTEAYGQYARVENETYPAREDPSEAFSEQIDEKDALTQEVQTLRRIYQAENDRLTRVAAGQEPATGVRALPNPEGRPAGEPVAVVDAEPEEETLVPEVKGSAKYASYQRIGGGTNYRELLNVWGNKKGDAYKENHYGNQGFANVQSHVRVEDHPHYNAPDIASELPDTRPGDSQGVRDAKWGIAQNREQIESDLELMRDLATESREIERRSLAAGEDPLANERQRELANRYSELNSRLSDKSRELASFYKKIADETGVKADGHTAVAVEFQSDLAQDAHKHGVARETGPDLMARVRSAEERRALAGDYLMDARTRLEETLGKRITNASDPLYLTVDGETLEVPEALARWPEASGAIGEFRDALTAYGVARDAENAMQDEWDGARHGVPASPWTDNKAATSLGVARFLLDSAERGYDRVAWSDSANRMAWAHLDAEPARTIYDEFVPSAVKRMLGDLGFKKVNVEHTFINGQGHWSVQLTRPMRDAIKRIGLPIFGVLALSAVPDQEADAQAPDAAFDAWMQDQPHDHHLGVWATGIGTAAAIGAVAYLRKNKGAAALVKATPALQGVMAIAREAAAANRLKGRPEFFPRRLEPRGVAYDAPIDAVTGKKPKPGLFNTPKLGLSPDGDNVWRQIVGQLGLKKKYVSWADTQAEADVRAAAGPADLLREKPWTGTDALAARLFQSSASERLAQVAKDLNNQTLTPEARAELAGQFGSLAADIADIAARAAGERESAGRTLNTYKIVARNTLDLPTWLMLAQRAKRDLPLTGEENLKIQGFIGDKDRIGLTGFISKLHRSTPLEKWLTFWKAGLLTGPPTHIANALSNTAEAARLAVKEPLAVGIDAMIALARGSEREKALSPRALTARIEGFKKGIGEAGQVLKSGVRPEDIGKWDVQQTNYDSPILQAYTQTVFRALAAADRPFRAMALEAALDELSTVHARRAVRADPKLDFAVTRDAIRQNPPNDLAAQAIAEAERAVFQDKGTLATMGSAFTRAAKNKSPVAGAAVGTMIPFVQTPANIATRFVDSTPLGLLTAGLRQAKAGPFDQKRFAEDVAGALTGSGGLMLLGYALAARGDATGSAPSSPTERDLWEAEQRRPNSVKLGGRWVNISRLGPAGMVIASGAQLHELVDKNPADAGKVAGGMLGTFGRVTTDQSFFAGISSALAAVNDPVRSGDSFTKALAGSLVPAAVGRAALASDPLQRETSSPVEQIESRVPGLSRRVPARLTIFGDPIERTTGDRALALVDPFYSTRARDEPLVAELRKHNVSVGQPPKDRRLGPERIEYTPDERREALASIGPLRREALGRVVATARYQQSPADEQKKLLRAALDAAEDRYYVQDDRRRIASRPRR